MATENKLAADQRLVREYGRVLEERTRAILSREEELPASKEEIKLSILKVATILKADGALTDEELGHFRTAYAHLAMFVPAAEASGAERFHEAVQKGQAIETLEKEDALQIIKEIAESDYPSEQVRKSASEMKQLYREFDQLLSMLLSKLSDESPRVSARRGVVMSRFTRGRWAKAFARVTGMFVGMGGFMIVLATGNFLLAVVLFVIGLYPIFHMPTHEELVPEGKVQAGYECLITGGLGLFLLWLALAVGTDPGVIIILLAGSTLCFYGFNRRWTDLTKPIDEEVHEAREERLAQEASLRRRAEEKEEGDAS